VGCSRGVGARERYEWMAQRTAKCCTPSMLGMRVGLNVNVNSTGGGASGSMGGGGFPVSDNVGMRPGEAMPGNVMHSTRNLLTGIKVGGGGSSSYKGCPAGWGEEERVSRVRRTTCPLPTPVLVSGEW